MSVSSEPMQLTGVLAILVKIWESDGQCERNVCIACVAIADIFVKIVTLWVRGYCFPVNVRNKGDISCGLFCGLRAVILIFFLGQEFFYFLQKKKVNTIQISKFEFFFYSILVEFCVTEILDVQFKFFVFKVVHFFFLFWDKKKQYWLHVFLVAEMKYFWAKEQL